MIYVSKLMQKEFQQPGWQSPSNTLLEIKKQHIWDLKKNKKTLKKSSFLPPSSHYCAIAGGNLTCDQINILSSKKERDFFISSHLLISRDTTPASGVQHVTDAPKQASVN